MPVLPSNLTSAADGLPAKAASLQAQLHSFGRLLVAYSGGVDSGFLAWAAHRELGAGMMAVLADSPSLARFQLRDAVAFADEHGIPLQIVETTELERAEYRRNDAARCFHCKDELFTRMQEYCQRSGVRCHRLWRQCRRSGRLSSRTKAAQQHGIAAPLLDAGLTKQDIRQLAREAGLRLWDKPASACLASRIEYGRR